MRGDTEQLFVEGGPGVGRELDLSRRDKQRELLWLGVRGLRRGDDASAQSVPWRENAVVSNRVSARRRDHGTQPSQETLSAQLGIGDSISAGLLEVDADLAVGGALHGTERKRGTQQIAADAFETLSVATINANGRMKRHAEARDRHRWGSTGLGPHGPRTKPGQPKLDAGRDAILKLSHRPRLALMPRATNWLSSRKNSGRRPGTSVKTT